MYHGCISLGLCKKSGNFSDCIWWSFFFFHFSIPLGDFSIKYLLITWTTHCKRHWIWNTPVISWRRSLKPGGHNFDVDSSVLFHREKKLILELLPASFGISFTWKWSIALYFDLNLYFCRKQWHLELGRGFKSWLSTFLQNCTLS